MENQNITRYQQPFSKIIMAQKYLKNGENTLKDIHERLIKKIISDNEKNEYVWDSGNIYNDEEYLSSPKDILSKLFTKFTFAGRIFSGLGIDYVRRACLVNCFGGETPVLTKEYGSVPIRDLVGIKVNVLNENRNWSEVIFKSYGEQETFPVSFRYANGKKAKLKVNATLGHRWKMPNGRIITTEFWKTSPNGKTQGFSRINHVSPKEEKIINEEYKQGILHGAIYGDGNRSSNVENTFHLSLFDEKKELTKIFTPLIGKEPVPTNHGKNNSSLRYNSIKNQEDLKDLPKGSLSYSFIRGFFAGILATDGSVSKGSKGVSEISIWGNKKLVDFLEKVLPITGISIITKRIAGKEGDKTNLCTRKSDLWCITVHPASINEEDIFRSKHKNSFHLTENQRKMVNVWYLKDIGEEGLFEEVFCCEERETGTFCLGDGLLTGNCTGSPKIEDSMEGIMKNFSTTSKLLQAGAGVGTDFSSLRPKSAIVKGVGGKSSGPVSFMFVGDSLGKTILLAGGRRGAQIAVLDVRHPDIFEFIECKRSNGLTQYNISCGIVDGFMDAVKNNEKWKLKFPIDSEDEKDVWDTPLATDIWDKIMRNSYEYAEPGVLFLDNANKWNTLPKSEDICISNPCGEIPGNNLLTCVLGQILIMEFIKTNFNEEDKTIKYEFDPTELEMIIYYAHRSIDDAIDNANLPTEEHTEELQLKRKRGLGFTGLGSALTLLDIEYGSEESVEFTKTFTYLLSYYTLLANLRLAEERGCCDFFKKDDNDPNCKGEERRKEFLESLYIQNLLAEIEKRESDKNILNDISKKILENGLRFTHGTALAPCGTISIVSGNNCSGGIEPVYEYDGERNVIVPNKSTKERFGVIDASLFRLAEDVCNFIYNKDWNSFDDDEKLSLTRSIYKENSDKKGFITANEISWKGHVDVMAASARFIDQAISKTVNLPTEISYEDFKNVYFYAHEKGVKGITVYRPNPIRGEVLVNKKEEEKTLYTFVSDDGSEVTVPGNQIVNYKGENHIASLLYDAINTNSFGNQMI